MNKVPEQVTTKEGVVFEITLDAEGTFALATEAAEARMRHRFVLNDGTWQLVRSDADFSRMGRAQLDQARQIEDSLNGAKHEVVTDTRSAVTGVGEATTSKVEGGPMDDEAINQMLRGLVHELKPGQHNKYSISLPGFDGVTKVFITKVDNRVTLLEIAGKEGDVPVKYTVTANNDSNQRGFGAYGSEEVVDVDLTYHFQSTVTHPAKSGLRILGFQIKQDHPARTEAVWKEQTPPRNRVEELLRAIQAGI